MEPMEYVLGAGIVVFTLIAIVRVTMLYLFPKDTG
jgi:hypothetical protein